MTGTLLFPSGRLFHHCSKLKPKGHNHHHNGQYFHADSLSGQLFLFVSSSQNSFHLSQSGQSCPRDESTDEDTHPARLAVAAAGTYKVPRKSEIHRMRQAKNLFADMASISFTYLAALSSMKR